MSRSVVRPRAPSFDVVALGEAVIDLFAPMGLTWSQARQFTLRPGGAPANVAVGAARLGLRVGFVGTVGDDPFGQLLRETLLQASVDVSHVRSTRLARTTLAWVTRPDAETSEFLFYRDPGADTLLSSDDIDPRYMRDAKVVHIGSVSLTAEPARSAALAAADLAHDDGALVSFDANWRPSLWGTVDARERMMPAITRADIVKVNAAESALLAGSDDPRVAARHLLGLGPSLVVVTRGRHGALFATAHAEGSVPAFPIQAVDPTGAGDGFIAGVLAGLIEQGVGIDDLGDLDAHALHEMVRLANACGALTASRDGAIAALPTRREVEEFLRRHLAPATAEA